jgi:hypothetical protein
MVCATNQFGKDSAMERQKLESAATEYKYLRGLYGIPLGLVIILAALGNWRWGPLRHDWAFIAGVALAGAACLPITRFYDERYGRVTLSTRQQVRAAGAALLAGPFVFGASLLARSRAGWSLDLPVNTIAASLALVMLATYAASVGIRRHHFVICGALLLAGVLPVWTGGDPSNIGLVLAGTATIANGVLDHRLLERTFGPPSGLDLADGDVRG